MNKCTVFRALPLSRDSRTGRYYKLLSNKFEVRFNTWEESDSQSGIFSFLKLSRTKFPLFVSYPFYILYLFLYSVFNISKKESVICMDLDVFVPVYLASLIRRFDVYFDIVDPISQTRYRSLPFSSIFDKIEWFTIKSNIKVILPSYFRLNYYLDSVVGSSKCQVKNLYICENIVEIEALSEQSKVCNSRDTSYKTKTIGYFGSLDDSRGIKELIDFVLENTDWKVIVAGRGVLSDYFKYIDNERFEFCGSYSPKDLHSLYEKVDIVWAYYDPKIRLHHYAAPNKFYEHLAFQTPIVFNECVPYSSYIKEKRTGYVISDLLSENEFIKLFERLELLPTLNSDFSDWDNKFKNYQFQL
ncbi:glycosyltransferase [Vibrio vulnificus]|uniref:glycosyltransferase n=1 Tax=Vibrio vulnificus TaxID=672 RepID=UPI0009355AA2|nr:glycosyltransferase [Vibrio vulnificus]